MDADADDDDDDDWNMKSNESFPIVYSPSRKLMGF